MAEYGEKLCEAISIIGNGLLSELKYDRTILCTVTDDSKAKDGEYIVSDGATKFTAYGSSDYKID